MHYIGEGGDYISGAMSTSRMADICLSLQIVVIGGSLLSTTHTISALSYPYEKNN